jgi:hypothetical protein
LQQSQQTNTQRTISSSAYIRRREEIHESDSEFGRFRIAWRLWRNQRRPKLYARATRLTTILGFNRVANEAACISPKSSIPRIVHCIGSMLPCSTVMERCAAGAAFAHAKSLSNSVVSYRVMCVTDTTALFGSSSNEDGNTFTSVWVQLFVDGEKAGRSTQVMLTILQRE